MILEEIGKNAAVLLAALLFDAIFADSANIYKHIPHPVSVLGRGIELLDSRLNRAARPPAVLFFLGAGASLALIGLAVLLGWLAAAACDRIPGGFLLEAVLAGTLLAARGLYDRVADCAAALGRDVQAGRAALFSLVGRDPQFLDESGVAKAAIESLGENFSDAVVAPLFWGVLFGLPGLLAYKTVNTLDSMIGYATPRHLWFGKFAARIDDAANFIPARLSALLVCLACTGLAPVSARRACRTVLRDARRHASWNAGWPEAAFAGALGIAIAGPRRSRAGERPAAWMGEGRRRPAVGDIRLALRLYLRACLLCAALLAAAALSAW